MRPKMLLVYLVAVLLSGCEFSGGGGVGDERPMGSGRTCTRRLSEAVDEQYLAEKGLEVKKGQKDAATIQVGGAIAEVCAAGPSTLTVDEGAQRVVKVIGKRYTD